MQKFKVVYNEFDIHSQHNSRPIFELIEVDNIDNCLIYWTKSIEKRGCNVEGFHSSFGSTEFQVVKIEQIPICPN